MNIKNSLIIALSAFIILTGCSVKKEPAKETNYSSGEIFQLISDAVSGNGNANEKLSSLFDYALPLPGDFNKVRIDSIKTSSGKKYFSVLLEHPNPVYNRIALYDSLLTLYLMDKSLNGSLSLSVIDSAADNLFLVKENFRSKDTLKLERITLYRVTDSTASLAFRSFIKLKEPNIEYSQEITELSPDAIKTFITSSRSCPINKKEDVFSFDKVQQEYVSSSSLFNNFVIEQVEKFSSKHEKPEITDQASAMQSLGITTGTDTITTASNAFNSFGFRLTLDEQWKELKKVSIDGFLKTEQKGTRYLNSSLGATISVVEISPGDSGESYIEYPFTQSSEGNYRVRFSDNIPSGKNFVRFIEYSCGSRKFLLIFEASRYTYEKYKSMYENIIFSFEMNC